MKRVAIAVTVALLAIPALAQVNGPVIQQPPTPGNPQRPPSGNGGGIGGVGISISLGGKKKPQPEPPLTGPPLEMRDLPGPDMVPGQVLFFIKGGDVNATQTEAMRIARAARVTTTQTTILPELGFTMVQARLTGADTISAALARLARTTGVEWSQPDFEFQVLGNSREQGVGLSGIRIGPKVRVTGTIALIDSPVDLANPALRGADIVQSGFGGDMTPAAHGTAIAEILAGTGPFAGVAQGARVASFAAFTPGGEAWWRSQSSRIIVAADRALALRPNVVNMSFGTRPDDPALARALDRFEERGVCVVAAAGNGSGAPVMFPARYPTVIAVTAVDGRRNIYAHASRGPQIAVAAWGVAMNAAVPGGRRAVSGTSFATAVVSGALLRQAPCANGRNPAAMRSKIARDALDLGPRGRDDVFGAGLFRLK